MTDLLDPPIERYGHLGLAPRIWELQDNFSISDAAYVALAESVVGAHTDLEVVVAG